MAENNANQPVTPMTHTQDLAVTTCCSCGIVFAYPKVYEQARRNDCKGFKCPNGHDLAYNVGEKTRDVLKTEVDKLTAELAEVKTKNITLQAQIDQLQAKLSDTPEKRP